MTNMTKPTQKKLLAVVKLISAFIVACARKHRLRLALSSFVTFTISGFAYSAVDTGSAPESFQVILSGLNLTLTSGVLIYAVKVEHRLTRLETLAEILTERQKK